MTVEFWYLIGAALVFWMQACFAMVETGFTRAKNAGNIIMKNLMDFCIGTIVFSLLGYSLMMGQDCLRGLVGLPNMDMWSSFKAFIASPTDGSFTGASVFVFNLVFCATAATIVSGAMAERTKFSAYCIYSAVISLFVYPIEAHWIWGGGWLSQLGFHDFAGSCAIHMVGGIAALVGAIFLGPRLGKYVRDESGKVIKVNAIPGHSITLGALGVFILWLGWYGFNGLRVTSEEELLGLDITEHGLPSAYPDFAPSVSKYAAYAPEEGVTVVTGDVPAAEAIPVKAVRTGPDGTPKFTKVEIICKDSKFDALKSAMSALGITGMTVSHVLGCGIQGGQPEYYRGVKLESNLLPKVQVDIVVSKIPVRSVIETAKRVLYTGHYGDGKIFVYDVENVVKIRTGEEGYDALQGEE